MSVYEYSYTSIEGDPVSMSDYRGQVLLIVNTASKCGYTPQFEGLEKLYKQYKDRGFAVIGFPCNQFGQQEPGGEADIQEFCSVRYGVTFPLSGKVDVRDEYAIPLYQYLTTQDVPRHTGKGIAAKLSSLAFKAMKGANAEDEVQWNFTKFLVNRQGEVVARFEPTITPEDIAPEIEKLL